MLKGQPFVFRSPRSCRPSWPLPAAPAKPASALPGWSFFPGLDSPENDCASPEDAGADRSPAALARLADARGGVAFNTGGERASAYRIEESFHGRIIFTTCDVTSMYVCICTGWVKRWVVPSCNWNRWTYEPGAGKLGGGNRAIAVVAKGIRIAYLGL